MESNKPKSEGCSWYGNSACLDGRRVAERKDWSWPFRSRKGGLQACADGLWPQSRNLSHVRTPPQTQQQCDLPELIRGWPSSGVRVSGPRVFTRSPLRLGQQVKTMALQALRRQQCSAATNRPWSVAIPPEQPKELASAVGP